MARMLHRREPPAQGQKVFIAIAAYEGCGAGFTWALAQTTAALGRSGIPFEIAIYSGNVHVDDSRNRLTRDFLLSDCTDMVFLDADIGWQASDFIALLSYDRDIVAGVYPKKNGDDTFPVKMPAGDIWSKSDGLIEVEGVPTGFLRIRRRVLETLAASSEVYNAKNDGAYSTACVFERQIHNGTRWGGDYVFSRKAREAGFEIHIAPDFRFEHAGEEVWTGNVGVWLRQRAGIAIPYAIALIQERRAKIEDIVDLFDAWDNPFAAAPVLLASLIEMAAVSKGPILECGSGLSSLVMAAANPHVEVHTLEDSPAFAGHLQEMAEQCGLTNLTIHCRPLWEGWYDAATLPQLDWAMVFIDGPRRSSGRRAEAPKHINLTRAVIVCDDAGENIAGAQLIEALNRTHDLITLAADEQRSFVVGTPRKRTTQEAA